MSVRSRSVADPLRSVNVFRDIFCRGSHKDIQDGYTDNKDSHGRATDINYRYDSQGLCGKFKQFDFSVASPRTHGISIGSHKDITEITDGRTGRKDDP